MKFPSLRPASALFPPHLGLGPAPEAVAAGQERAGGGLAQVQVNAAANLQARNRSGPAAAAGWRMCNRLRACVLTRPLAGLESDSPVPPLSLAPACRTSSRARAGAQDHLLWNWPAWNFCVHLTGSECCGSSASRSTQRCTPRNRHRVTRGAEFSDNSRTVATLSKNSSLLLHTSSPARPSIYDARWLLQYLELAGQHIHESRCASWNEKVSAMNANSRDSRVRQ